MSCSLEIKDHLNLSMHIVVRFYEHAMQKPSYYLSLGLGLGLGLSLKQLSEPKLFTVVHSLSQGEIKAFKPIKYTRHGVSDVRCRILYPETNQHMFISSKSPSRYSLSDIHLCCTVWLWQPSNLRHTWSSEWPSVSTHTPPNDQQNHTRRNRLLVYTKYVMGNTSSRPNICYTED